MKVIIFSQMFTESAAEMPLWSRCHVWVVLNSQADPEKILVPALGSLRRHFQGFLFLKGLQTPWQMQQMPQF